MRFTLIAAAAALFAGQAFGAHSAGTALDTSLIEQLTGAKGQLDEKEGVFKVSVPRTDLQLTVGGVKVPPSMELTSWGAFQGSARHAMVMGDLVLSQDQVNPVMSVALENGHRAEAGIAMGVNTWAAFAGSDDQAVVDGDFAMLEGELQPVLKVPRGAGIDSVAIHQHMTGEQPRVLFLPYWGVGSTTELAQGLRAALDRTATRLGAR